MCASLNIIWPLLQPIFEDCLIRQELKPVCSDPARCDPIVSLIASGSCRQVYWYHDALDDADSMSWSYTGTKLGESKMRWFGVQSALKFTDESKKLKKNLPVEKWNKAERKKTWGDEWIGKGGNGREKLEKKQSVKRREGEQEIVTK